MARLSINDLNNLSNVNNDEEKLYKQFRRAHTLLYNKMNNWVNNYNKKLDMVKNKDDYTIYKTLQEYYYEGSMLLDSIDLFDEFTKDYLSLLYYLKKSDKEIKALLQVLKNIRKPMITKMSECYGMYSEAYSRLNEWED